MRKIMSEILSRVENLSLPTPYFPLFQGRLTPGQLPGWPAHCSLTGPGHTSVRGSVE